MRETYCDLNHFDSVLSHLSDEAEDVYFPLGISHVQHGVKSDVGPCAADSSTNKANNRGKMQGLQNVIVMFINKTRLMSCVKSNFGK